MTEGAGVTLDSHKLYRNVPSLTRPHRELPPGGSLWFVRPESLSDFPDKHCFCGHKSKAPHKAGQFLFDKIVFKIQIFLIIIKKAIVSG